MSSGIIKDKESKEKRGLGTESYKGVRDFYPPDMFLQNYIFGIMRKVAKSFGYEEYNASVLEPAGLYRGKTNEEIVNEQTYTFVDRGGREVTLRPEMTPTVARMIAAKRKLLQFPVRWYSIQNFFRYEKPQRGRLREYWQLNADIFGLAGVQGEIEVISLATEILENFGLKKTDYEIRLNSRKITDYIIKKACRLQNEAAKKAAKLLDKKDKITKEQFEKELVEIAPEKSDFLKTFFYSENFEELASRLPPDKEISEAFAELKELKKWLEDLGITNIALDQTLMRGFDYYTGVVFEIFDTDPKNKRSLFGGGRYDKLLSIFGVENIPTVGFGMGDVTILNALETRGLLPEYKCPIGLALCVAEPSAASYINDLAQEFRRGGLNVNVDYSKRKLGDQIKAADKQGIPFVICVGSEEMKSGALKIKELKTGKETALADDKILDFFKNL